MDESDRKAAKERAQRNRTVVGSSSGSKAGLSSRAKTPMRKIVIKDEMRSAGGGTAGGTSGRPISQQIVEDLGGTMPHSQGP